MAKKNPTKTETNNQVNNPMMKQYEDMKKRHPDTLLLFRCGDFYETYEDDAEVCAKTLGVTLTKSTTSGVRMAGFPYHALDKYLPKLIRSGNRIAICDQLEKPAKTERPKTEDVKAEPVAETPEPKKRGRKPSQKKDDAAPQLVYSTYQNAAGRTCAKISGFKEDDTAYQMAGLYNASKSWDRKKDGSKDYSLIFGPIYAAAAELLCKALNAKDDAQIKAAHDCFAEALKAHRDMKSESRKAFMEKVEKRKAGKAQKAKAPKEKTYTESQLRELLERYANGESVPEIENLINNRKTA